MLSHLFAATVAIFSVAGAQCSENLRDSEARRFTDKNEQVQTASSFDIEDELSLSIQIPPTTNNVSLLSTDAFPPLLSNARLAFVPESTEFGTFTVESTFIRAVGTGVFFTDHIDPRRHVMSVSFPEPNIEIELVGVGTLSTGFSVTGTMRHSWTRPPGMVLVESKKTVAEGIAALRALNFSDTESTLLAVVDHAKSAASVGLSLPPTSVALIGTPNLTSSLLLADGAIGHEFPHAILLATSPLGKVYTGYTAPSMLFRRYSVDANRDILVRLDRALAKLASSASGTSVAPMTLDFDVERFKTVEPREGLSMSAGTGSAQAAFENVLKSLRAAAPNVGIALEVMHNSTTSGHESGVVIFGNPKLGTSVMQASFTAALDLPVRIGVYTSSVDSAKFNVVYASPLWIGERHNVTGIEPRLADALANFAKEAQLP